MKNVVVHLLGLAGTGKLTIAQALCNHMDAVLLDAHVINNPIFRAVKADGVTKLPETVRPLTHRIRQAVLQAIEECAPKDANYIFTNAPYDSDAQDRAHMEEMWACFDRIGAIYIPVRLLCSEEELVKRRTGPGRKANYKDTNPDHARHEARTHQVMHTGRPYELTLDVTTLSPEDAAEKIMNHINAVVNEAA